jgi:hypothetical protein
MCATDSQSVTQRPSAASRLRTLSEFAVVQIGLQSRTPCNPFAVVASAPLILEDGSQVVMYQPFVAPHSSVSATMITRVGRGIHHLEFAGLSTCRVFLIQHPTTF